MIVMSSGSQLSELQSVSQNCETCQNCQSCQSCQSCLRLSTIVNNCQNVGQVMFPHYSDQMPQTSQVSRVGSLFECQLVKS